ncbi:hypothetical protein PHLGIDRAFT_136385 [Phlebiopsis gigantea 11061_1 CR5-6]|uniref:Uncharacterized protein n=1 Tax=Phlebiopsis gigantea (strain 11061_1 CR5-6) TaxID=745531 RepID=A0A0C3PXH8_PHLG1|nr:hypothetical protein PHLGIDRAFT_136385 [Phlebiopsis gigantea 11061_1 CR5-6]
MAEDAQPNEIRLNRKGITSVPLVRATTRPRGGARGIARGGIRGRGFEPYRAPYHPPSIPSQPGASTSTASPSVHNANSEHISRSFRGSPRGTEYNRHRGGTLRHPNEGSRSSQETSSTLRLSEVQATQHLPDPQMPWPNANSRSSAQPPRVYRGSHRGVNHSMHRAGMSRDFPDGTRPSHYISAPSHLPEVPPMPPSHGPKMPLAETSHSVAQASYDTSSLGTIQNPRHRRRRRPPMVTDNDSLTMTIDLPEDCHKGQPSMKAFRALWLREQLPRIARESAIIIHAHTWFDNQVRLRYTPRSTENNDAIPPDSQSAAHDHAESSFQSGSSSAVLPPTRIIRVSNLGPRLPRDAVPSVGQRFRTRDSPIGVLASCPTQTSCRPF